MKINLKALVVTGMMIWSGSVGLVGLANFVWPPYGLAFLEMVDSIYPGYHAGTGLSSVVIGMLYAALDGAVGFLIIGWLYNALADRFK